MNLYIIGFDIEDKEKIVVTFKYDNQEFVSKFEVKESVVSYIEYDERLQEILHKDVGEAKNLNRVIFKIYRKEPINLPIKVAKF